MAWCPGSHRRDCPTKSPRYGAWKPGREEASSPNCNPHAERFVETTKYECLNHLVLFGERHLHHVIKEFMAHYHRERFHQWLDGQLIEAQPPTATDKTARGKVVRRSRLGGMLNFYCREAA
jgi:putative transposase